MGRAELPLCPLLSSVSPTFTHPNHTLAIPSSGQIPIIMSYSQRVNQGTQKKASQGASEYRQISLSQSKPIFSVVQTAGEIHSPRNELNAEHPGLIETKPAIKRTQPGYSGLFRDKEQNDFFHAGVPPKILANVKEPDPGSLSLCAFCVLLRPFSSVGSVWTA